MELSNNTVPSTTTFESALKLDSKECNCDEVVEMKNDPEVYELLDKQLELSHKRADEQVGLVDKTAKKLIDKEGEIAELKAKIKELEANKDKIVIGRKGFLGELVTASGSKAEEVKEEIHAAYKDELIKLERINNKGFRQVEQLQAEIAGLKDKLEIQANRHGDAIAVLESEHASSLEDRDLEIKEEKAMLLRKYDGEMLEERESIRQREEATLREIVRKENEIDSDRRNLRVEYDVIYDNLVRLHNKIKDSFWLRLVGLTDRVADNIKALNRERFNLPAWG